MDEHVLAVRNQTYRMFVDGGFHSERPSALSC